MIPLNQSLTVTLDAASNKLVISGENFSFLADNDLDAGRVLRLVLVSRSDGQVALGTLGAPTAQHARHLFTHKTAVKNCPWCSGLDKKFLAELVKDLPTPLPSLDKLDL